MLCDIIIFSLLNVENGFAVIFVGKNNTFSSPGFSNDSKVQKNNVCLIFFFLHFNKCKNIFTHTFDHFNASLLNKILLCT